MVQLLNAIQPNQQRCYWFEDAAAKTLLTPWCIKLKAMMSIYDWNIYRNAARFWGNFIDEIIALKWRKKSILTQFKNILKFSCFPLCIQTICQMQQTSVDRIVTLCCTMSNITSTLPECKSIVFDKLCI